MILWGAVAQAQWAWKDDKGHVVYSDRPPPAHIKEGQIINQPSGNALNAVGASPSGAATTQGPKTWAEREAEYKKRQMERAQAQQAQAEEREQQAQRQGDCERTRSYLATLESGTRIIRTGPDGERNYLDDAQRASERIRAQEIISRSCI